MNKVKLHKSEGYAKFNAKRQGIFITHKRGVFKDAEKEIPYHKCRLTQVYKHPKGNGMSMTLQKPPRYIAFDIDMLKNVAELLTAIHQEIYGEPLYGGEIKEMPATKSSNEVDELLAELAGMKGRK